METSSRVGNGIGIMFAAVSYIGMLVTALLYLKFFKIPEVPRESLSGNDLIDKVYAFLYALGFIIKPPWLYWLIAIALVSSPLRPRPTPRPRAPIVATVRTQHHCTKLAAATQRLTSRLGRAWLD